MIIMVNRFSGPWATWHLAGGPVGPSVQVAATSNVEVRPRSNDLLRLGEMVGRERSEESEGQRHKEEREGESGMAEGTQGTIGREGSILIFVHPEFLVTPLLMGPVCLLSQGWFEEPVRPCVGLGLIPIFCLGMDNAQFHYSVSSDTRHIWEVMGGEGCCVLDHDWSTS